MVENDHSHDGAVASVPVYAVKLVGGKCSPISQVAAMPFAIGELPTRRSEPGYTYSATGLKDAQEEAKMELADKVLNCVDCGSAFVFTVGEQLFFRQQQFQNDPKRCKPCKAKRATAPPGSRPETHTTCSQCGAATTVPFLPTQGRPVLCRPCFQSKRGDPRGAAAR